MHVASMAHTPPIHTDRSRRSLSLRRRSLRSRLICACISPSICARLAHVRKVARRAFWCLLRVCVVVCKSIYICARTHASPCSRARGVPWQE
jgi:hypothetical protein